MTPTKHGLYSKYRSALIAEELEEAHKHERLEVMEQTAYLLAAILAFWTKQSWVQQAAMAQPVAAVAGKLASIFETYEKLTNPEMRTSRINATVDLNINDFSAMTEEQLKIKAAEAARRAQELANSNGSLPDRVAARRDREGSGAEEKS
jgi:hypothetical protein